MTWIAGVCAALLLYLLSWGPVMAHYGGPRPGYLYRTLDDLLADLPPLWVVTFYSPIESLYEKPIIGNVFSSYLDWSCRHFR